MGQSETDDIKLPDSIVIVQPFGFYDVVTKDTINVPIGTYSLRRITNVAGSFHDWICFTITELGEEHIVGMAEPYFKTRLGDYKKSIQLQSAEKQKKRQDNIPKEKQLTSEPKVKVQQKPREASKRKPPKIE